jgi:peptidoglycan hydrolase CwlO-like protein
MEQKTKFILIGLAGISVVCFFLFISTLNSKREVIRERDDLKSENTSLTGKIDKLEGKLREFDSKVNSLNNELQAARRDKEDAEARYSQVKGERDSLAEKLKTRFTAPVAVESAATPVSVGTQTADAYWGGILKAKTDLELQVREIRNQLKSVQINSEELQRQKTSLELDIRNLTNERDDLKRRIEYNQKVSDSISQELVREKNDKSLIQESNEVLRRENQVLTRQIKSLSDKKVSLEKKVQELQEGSDTVTRRVDEMETMLSDKVSQIDDLKDKLEAIRQNRPGAIEESRGAVELPAIVVRPSQGPSSSAPSATTFSTVKGRVLSINRDNNFIVVDLGEDAGVKPGDNFRVYREEKPIASVEAIQVRRTISACDIKKETTSVKIGDVVR